VKCAYPIKTPYKPKNWLLNPFTAALNQDEQQKDASHAGHDSNHFNVIHFPGNSFRF
jgi:hypothetical protein